MCHNTEVFPLETDQYTFSCTCNMLSTTCSWSLFADRENTFNSGTNESQFGWKSSIGYGQYVCVEDNATIVRDIPILPQGEKSKTMIGIFLCVWMKGVAIPLIIILYIFYTEKADGRWVIHSVSRQLSTWTFWPQCVLGLLDENNWIFHLLSANHSGNLYQSITSRFLKIAKI